jgi:O-glycosyl hydrolase
MKATAVAGGSDFFSAWLTAAESAQHEPHSDAPRDPHDWSAYQPKFFSRQAVATLDAFTRILIPTDETPGAKEAFVVPFIDFVVDAAAQYAPDMQQRWRAATEWLAQQGFSRLAPEQQVAFITRISAPERDPKSPRDRAFQTYQLIKDMTVHAYYTSRVGLVDALQYKGLAYLTEFPACTHSEHWNV